MNRTRLGVDTNVFVYAIDRRSPKHSRAVSWLEKIGNGDYTGVVSCQNLTELYAVLTNKKVMRAGALSVVEAIGQIKDIVDKGVFEVVFPSGETISLFRELLKEVRPVGQVVHDVFLAATLLSNGVDTLLTANGQDFAKIRGLRTIDLIDTSAPW